MDHGAKEGVIHNHFKEVFAYGAPRKQDFNWNTVHFETPHLHELGDPFTEEEVKNAIDQIPNDKAPRPDGFTGAFFQKMLGHYQERRYEGCSPIWEPTCGQLPLA